MRGRSLVARLGAVRNRSRPFVIWAAWQRSFFHKTVSVMKVSFAVKAAMAAAVLFSAPVWAAQPPEVSDEEVAYLLEGISGGVSIPPERKKAIESQVRTQLQVMRILANEARRAGLDKTPQAKMIEKIALDQAYAGMFQQDAMNRVEVTEKEVNDAYLAQTTNFIVQTVSYDSKEKAENALQRLRKGAQISELSATEGTSEEKRLAVTGRSLDLRSFDEATRERLLAATPGKIFDEPARMGNKWVVMKFKGTERKQESNDFTPGEIKEQLRFQIKARKADQNIEKLLIDNGIDVAGLQQP